MEAKGLSEILSQTPSMKKSASPISTEPLHVHPDGSTEVTVVHVSAVAKNAADDKLHQSLRRFAHTYHPPCTVVLISGDVNFAAELKDLRHAHNITITLVHNIQTSDALKVFANKLVLFDDLLQDLEPTHLQPPSSRCTVLVSGLPRRGDHDRIAGMLGVMSDNCGGKVLFVDVPAGMAHITYRSYESALKSSKRLTGENVFGSMITAVIEQDPQGLSRAQSSPHPLSLRSPAPRPPSGPLLPHPPRSLSGPQPHPPPQQFPPTFSDASFPPLPHPLPVPSGMNYPPPPRNQPPLLQGPFPPPRPTVRGPRPPRHPHTAPSHTRPQFQFQSPRLEGVAHGPPPLQQWEASPPPDSVHLLVNTMSGCPDRMEEVAERVLGVCTQASVKAKVVHRLWYKYSELRILLWLDILQSAIEQNDSVADLYKKGNMSIDIARIFAGYCCKAIEKACQQQWKVEVCKWGDDEKRDVFIRSHVIELLIATPGRWMTWVALRREYQKRWKASVSEMDVMTACKGAASILGRGERVVVISEYDPMVRVHHDPTTEKTLKDNVVSLLTGQKSRKIKLLDIVKEYTNLFGSLPLLPGVNGKPFSLVVESIPEVEVGGSVLFNTFVTLKKTQTVQSTAASAKSKCKPPVANACSLNLFGLLINTGSEQPENMEGLRDLVAEICLQANIIVERVAFLRYSCSEMHVHLRVDFLQSARAQRDAVADLCQLTPEVVNSFGVVCCQAVQKVCQLRKLPWQVGVCSWREDEERDREMRSQVIELLLQSPSKWMMWNDFRDLYLERFKTKIESVKPYKDAVVLLNSPPLDNQAICLHELSPQAKLSQDEKALHTVMSNMVTLLGTLPDKKIPLLSIVEAYNKLFGKLPLVQKKGKSLVDVLKSQPGIEVTGDKLSNQVVALSDEQRPCLQASAEKIDSSLGTESESQDPTLTEAKSVYEQAMKKGYVETSVTKCLIVGAAGVGKTHLKHLLLKKDPPGLRVSTGVAENPIRAVSFSLFGQDGEDWFIVENDETLIRIAAETLKKKDKIKMTSSLVDVVQDLPKIDVHSISFGMEGDTQESSHVDEGESNDIQDRESIVGPLEKEFIDCINRSSDEKKVLDVKWIQFIDSGGQSEYHEILPLFVQNTSVTVFVLNLSETLSHYPTIEYYGSDGKPIGKAYQSPLSHEQILHRCLGAIYSQDKDSKPMIITVGTHRDTEHTCSESIEEKNRKLDLLFDPNNFRALRLVQSLIIPLNCKVPTEEDKMVAKVLQNGISQDALSKVKKMPIAWFGLEVLLRKSSHGGVLTLSECQECAKKLHIQGEVFSAALHHLVHHNMFLYYPEVLPQTVFCDPQVILSKVSKLVQFYYKLKTHSDECALQLVDANILRLFIDHALISVELLDSFFGNLFVEGQFSSKEFVSILVNRSVISVVNDKDYLMPSLLPHLEPKETVTYCPKCDQISALAIHFKRGCAPTGVFCGLVAYLISAKNPYGWKVCMDRRKPSCLYRNCIMLVMKCPGIVTLTDNLSHFEVHVDGASIDQCREIKECIHNGILSACAALNYSDVDFEDGFACPGTRCSVDPPHVAVVTCSLTSIGHVYKWRCTIIERQQGDLNGCQLVWLNTNASTKRPMQENDHTLSSTRIRLDGDLSESPTNSGSSQGPLLKDLMNDVAAKIPSKWRGVGIQLQISPSALDSIQNQNGWRPQSDQICFEHVFMEWRKLSPSCAYLWKTIIDALKQPAVGENHLADTLATKYC